MLYELLPESAKHILVKPMLANAQAAMAAITFLWILIIDSCLLMSAKLTGL
jgi:hypothetical protein